MKEQLAYILGIMALTIIISSVISAEEINATLNSVTNNETLNDSSISNYTLLTDTKSNNVELNQTKNLSTINDKPPALVGISEIAKNAPEVAVVASSAQITIEPSDSIRIGNGVGGWDPFNPKHKVINNTKIGLPIKPMRDTGKMFFVCDIV